MIITDINKKNIINKKEYNSKFFSVHNKIFKTECKILKDNFFIDSFNFFPITDDGHTFRDLFTWGNESKYNLFYTKQFNDKFNNNIDNFKVFSNVYVLGSSANDNYYSNLITFLPRIFFLKQNEISLAIHRNSSNKFRNIILHILKKLNVKLNKFVYLDDDYFKFNNSEIPEFLKKNISIKILNKRFASIEQKKPQIKIFISRQNTNYRNLINEDDIIKTLKLNDFKIIDPNNLTIFEQIKIFRRAKVVIGTSGSALANIVFCKKGTKILEIAPKYQFDYENLFKNRYSDICKILSLDYARAIADSVENNYFKKSNKFISKKVLKESNYYKDLLFSKSKIENLINNF